MLLRLLPLNPKFAGFKWGSLPGMSPGGGPWYPNYGSRAVPGSMPPALCGSLMQLFASGSAVNGPFIPFVSTPMVQSARFGFRGFGSLRWLAVPLLAVGLRVSSS